MIRESLAGDRIGCQEQSPQESPAGTGKIRILIHWLLRSNKNTFLWKWKHLCGKWLWYTKSKHKTPPLWTSSDYCRLKLLVNIFMIVTLSLFTLLQIFPRQPQVLRPQAFPHLHHPTLAYSPSLPPCSTPCSPADLCNPPVCKTREAVT